MPQIKKTLNYFTLSTPLKLMNISVNNSNKKSITYILGISYSKIFSNFWIWMCITTRTNIIYLIIIFGHTKGIIHVILYIIKQLITKELLFI